MNHIKLNHFKPFKNQGIELKLDNDKNLLLLGENGSGKTSISDALKLFFYKNKILNIPSHLVGAARNAEVRTRLYKYRNAGESNIDIDIQIDGVSLDCSNDYNQPVNVFFIGPNELRNNQDLSLDRILSSAFFPSYALSLVSDLYWTESFVKMLNQELKESFYEDLELRIKQGEGHCLEIHSLNSDLSSSTHVYDDFNEAAVHLVVLVILFEIIKLNYDPSKKNIIILDDIINSLDIRNRGLIFSYIIKNFAKFQILIFTHNVSYFNLCKYIRNVNDPNSSENWAEESLYVMNGVPVLSRYNHESCVKDLLAERERTDIDIEELGNKIRKRFETLLYEIANLLHLGNFYETSEVLESLVGIKDQEFYISLKNGRVSTALDLLQEIHNVLKSGNEYKLRKRLLDKFAAYEHLNNLKWLQDIMKDMKIYQKVVLHQLSHTQVGRPTFHRLEINIALELLKKMEDFVRKGKNINNGGNVYTI